MADPVWEFTPGKVVYFDSGGIPPPPKTKLIHFPEKTWQPDIVS